VQVLKSGLVVIGAVFLIGCTTKKEDALMQSYQQKVDYHKQLQKTEKIQLFENNATKAVLTATYLYAPNFEKYDRRDEQFIVGVHLEDETVVDTKDIIEIFGIRDSDDIKKMRDKSKQESEHADNSLFSDINALIGLRDKNEIIKIDDEKKSDDKNSTEDNNTTVPIYGLTLDRKKAIKIKELSKNDERLKNIAYVTDWGSYYLVTFEHTKSKRFSLVFKSDKYGNGTFSFAKVAKYIYTKKGF